MNHETVVLIFAVVAFCVAPYVLSTAWSAIKERLQKCESYDFDELFGPEGQPYEIPASAKQS